VIAVAFEFLAGRYHAAPWDRHANEGAVEWPPSPWRILRTLVAASYRIEPRPTPHELGHLIEKLTAPPIYRAPRCSEGHTRHYMPTDGKPTLVFDAFIAVGGGAGARDAELVVGWPEVELEPAELQLLDNLLATTGYLGRAESWVAARRVEWQGEDANIRPATTDLPSVRGTVRLQSALPSAEYEAWSVTAPKPGRNARLPRNVLEVLHQSTEDLHRQGWSIAPGSTWLTYERPESLTGVRPTRRVATRARTLPTFARYAVSSAVLPRLTEAVAIGERLRVALMSYAGQRDADTLALFSGKDAEGRPLLDVHRHAFYLPADEDNDGRIDHLVVFANGGFSDDSRRVLESLHRLWGHGGHDLSLALIGFGNPADYAASETGGGTALAGISSTWESRTPVVLPRHTKFRGGRWVDTPDEQVIRMVEQLGHPRPVSVERTDGTSVNGSHVPWFRFRRVRLNGGGRMAGAKGFGFRLRFAEPVRGPIAIGYGAHVGLGQFVAVT